MRGNMEQEGMSLFMIPEVFSNTQSTAFHMSYFYYIKQVLGEDKPMTRNATFILMD